MMQISSRFISLIYPKGLSCHTDIYRKINKLMPTARPFAYNPGATGAIPGTEQLGDLAIGTPSNFTVGELVNISFA
jgi:hypothetical protein